MNELGLLIWYAGAVMFGASFAWLISMLFGLVVKPGSTGVFMRSLRTGIQELLLGEDDAFWAHYKKLLVDVFAYVGRQLGGVLLAFAPLIIAMLIIGPWIMAKWEHNAPWVVVPESAGQLQTAQAGTAAELTLLDGATVALPNEPGSVAICYPGEWSCLLLTGFRISCARIGSAI